MENENKGCFLTFPSTKILSSIARYKSTFMLLHTADDIQSIIDNVEHTVMGGKRMEKPQWQRKKSLNSHRTGMFLHT